MEKLCDELIDYLIDDLKPYLDELKTDSVPLPYFSKKNCVLSAIDFGKYQMNQVCFVLPDIQNSNPLSIDENETSTRIDIFIFCSGKPAEVLLKQALRYGAAIKNLVKDNYSMNGVVSQIYVNEFDFFEDVTANDKRMTGAKLTVTLINEE